MKSGDTKQIKVVAARPVHGAYLMRFEGIDDRSAAEPLAGATLAIDAAAMPPPADGEVYLYELVGAEVCDAEGARLGTVKAVSSNGGQDLLVIGTPRGERLLPLVPALFLGFDRKSSVATVVVPEGLWDEA